MCVHMYLLRVGETTSMEDGFQGARSTFLGPCQEAVAVVQAD